MQSRSSTPSTPTPASSANSTSPVRVSELAPLYRGRKLSRREKVEALMGKTSCGPSVPTSIPTTPSQPLVYELRVVQQPLQAKLCPLDTKDFRGTDPTPILQLVVQNPVTGIVDPSVYHNPFLVVHASLWSADQREERNLLSVPPHHHYRTLFGSLVSSSTYLKSPNGGYAVHFAFPELYVRAEGRYTLQFSLIRLGSNDSVSQAPSSILATTFSQPLTVYSAKDYPGALETTELSRFLSKQGLRIPMRSDARTRKTSD